MAAQKQKQGRVVVVGYDGTRASREAVRVAASHAGKNGKLYIVHAYPPPSDWLGYPNYDHALEKHQRHGQEVLDHLLADAALLSGTDYETELLSGDSPAVAITDVASARGADEIVVGAHEHHRLRDMLGGVSHDLLQEAASPGAVPVVVVPRPG